MFLETRVFNRDLNKVGCVVHITILQFLLYFFVVKVISTMSDICRVIGAWMCEYIEILQFTIICL